MRENIIYLYGAPASGKSTVGRFLAEILGKRFIDLDNLIETSHLQKVSEIFKTRGEKYFRDEETKNLKGFFDSCNEGGKLNLVVALGGGSLLRPENREYAEKSGKVICIHTPIERIAERASRKPLTRPLAENEEFLRNLLESRKEHYNSFACSFDTANTSSPKEVALGIAIMLGEFCVRGMGKAYQVYVDSEVSKLLPEVISELEVRPKHILIVGDDNTLPLYGEKIKKYCENFAVSVFEIKAGESSKTLETVERIWQAMLKGGIERNDLVIALGGGVVGDLTGFASATWLRGVRWLNLPTSLLSMVDAGIGGKTGADLPAGKNLIGAFHPPCAVICDTAFLKTLPEREFLCGFAETYKHAVIGRPELVPLLKSLKGKDRDIATLTQLVRLSVSVKIKTILADPYEQNSIRVTLNLGHSIGHAVEAASNFEIQHGEAVAIGMVAAARISAEMKFTTQTFADTMKADLEELGLPTEIPSLLDRRLIKEILMHDKKKSGETVKFILPISIGEVKVGCIIPERLINKILEIKG